VLVVNTASKCGLTPQYEGLEALYAGYKGRGLVVLGVPCNQFAGQEPGTEAEIKDFCETRFAVDFPLTGKVDVKDADAHPFYRWAAGELGEAAVPVWNFHKILIGKHGEALQAFGGWGRATTRAVAGWYQREDVSQLAYQAVKYRQREGWTHADLLRLSHPKAPTAAHRDLYAWIVDGVMPADGEAPKQVKGFEQLQNVTDAAEAAKLITEYRLPWETVPTELRSSPEVWAALLEEMPLTAMIRNLATMTRIGLVAPMAEATRRVVAELGDRERIRRARVHPLAILAALKTYEQGHGERGRHSWTPVQGVVNALNDAFYLAFDNVEATGKRWLLGVDVSGSMSTGAVAGVAGMTPRVAAAAMTLVTAATEPQHVIMSFQKTFVPLSISPRERLDDVIRKTNGLPFGGTDCALPMLYATERKIPVDVFVVYTDSETWYGQIHPVQALRQYREKTGIPAKLIVVAFVANRFSIADPADGGMLDVVGFDTSVPALIRDFAAN